MKKTLIILGIIILAIVVLYLLNKRFNFWANMSRPSDSGKNPSYRFFKMSEFDSQAEFPSDNGKDTYTHNGIVYLNNSGEENMQASFMNMLLSARLDIENNWNAENTLKPIVFRINSGYRTPAHNTAVGGATTSEHMDGQAADIRTTGYDEDQKHAILGALYRAGFRRYGMGRTFIHADNDTGKSSPAVWNYGTGYSMAGYEIENIALVA